MQKHSHSEREREREMKLEIYVVELWKDDDDDFETALDCNWDLPRLLIQLACIWVWKLQFYDLLLEKINKNKFMNTGEK